MSSLSPLPLLKSNFIYSINGLSDTSKLTEREALDLGHKMFLEKIIKKPVIKALEGPQNSPNQITQYVQLVRESRSKDTLLKVLHDIKKKLEEMDNQLKSKVISSSNSFWMSNNIEEIIKQTIKHLNSKHTLIHLSSKDTPIEDLKKNFQMCKPNM